MIARVTRLIRRRTRSLDPQCLVNFIDLAGQTISLAMNRFDHSFRASAGEYFSQLPDMNREIPFLDNGPIPNLAKQKILRNGLPVMLD